MLFPSGNWSGPNQRQRRHMAVYVECPDLDEEEPGWGLQATLHITLVNQLDPSTNFRKGWHCPCNPESQRPHAHTHHTSWTITTITIITALTPQFLPCSYDPAASSANAHSAASYVCHR